MAEERSLIGELLLKKGIITQEQLNAAYDEHMRTNAKIGAIFVSRGFATEEDIARALSEQLDFAYVDLSTYQIQPDALSVIPAQAAARLNVIPLFKVEDSLTIAMSDPLDIEIIDELSSLAGALRIKPILATSSAINEAIKKYYGKQVVIAPVLPAAVFPGAARRLAVSPEKEPAGLIEAATQRPVIEIVNKLIEDAVKANASDIHLEPQENALYCRFRIDGVLHEVKAPPANLQLAVISRIKIMADMDIAQTRLPQDGRIQLRVLERNIDLRIATFPTIHGEHVAMRILDKTQGIVKLEELGFQQGTLSKFKDVIRRPFGLLLVTGPTGSGKTTTLYSVLNTINDLKKNIITVEDPVEYTIERIHQSQVNVKAGLTFASGLRSIVRLDPDVIMIGEIRDKDTAEIAIHSSLTGHLVLSTLHTNDAPSAATRLVDIGVEPYLLASSLIGVLAQRLVRKLCPKCKKANEPVGCKDCRNTGYSGRTGIFEFFSPDAKIKELIIKKAPAYEIKEAAIKSGMNTLRDDGMQKVKQGITSLAEVIRVTEEV